MKPQIEVTYSKKLGLPNFSSHCLTVSVRAEVGSVSEVPGQTTLLYRLLQDSVDEEMQRVGFVPENRGYGQPVGSPSNTASLPDPAPGTCTPPQRAMIIDLARKHKLNKKAVDALALKNHGVAARELTALQAASFIKELRNIDKA